MLRKRAWSFSISLICGLLHSGKIEIIVWEIWDSVVNIRKNEIKAKNQKMKKLFENAWDFLKTVVNISRGENQSCKSKNIKNIFEKAWDFSKSIVNGHLYLFVRTTHCTQYAVNMLMLTSIYCVHWSWILNF